jgi:hypothetical protein
MTSSNQIEKKTDPKLLSSLERIGAREILIWKELVLQDDSLFVTLYNLIYSDNQRIAWHAAWIVDQVSEADPFKLEPFVPELIDQLPNLKSNSLKRHFTRMLLSQKIPEDKMGPLVNVLYELLSPSHAIAVRANALQLLHNIALIEPDLKPELLSVTESILEEELTSGMRSKAKNIARSLKRQ